MPVQLSSKPEQRALEAQNLQSFSRVNLLGIKEGVKDLLLEFGKNAIFSEYTRHDLSHIDTLLEILDWVVIPKTIETMTPADWMMIVLSIYFHDAGLVVTKKEFDEREGSEFPIFRDAVLSLGASTPYSERVCSMSPEDQERFLYQEFVRTYHADRIRCWIKGENGSRFGIASDAQSVVASLLAVLTQDFRHDLALICESHHRSDLNETSIYDPRRAYGSGSKQTVNLQFAAILLRTVDLLHVTQDRTPSVAFRLTSPADPKSIEEWHKQMPVVSVRKSPARDAQGNVDPSGVSETIEVSATFHNPLGFFSLTEYLHYAETELKQSFGWAEQTRNRESINYIFPWRRIDTSAVKAVGFESKHFAFELDKPKILKLLTGHTLYSNPDVVVRELVQNSLDAVRLQSDKSKIRGQIVLGLDSSRRTLTITDNGTGMTQRIIEDHFLNVGSSRYRDEAFRKANPNFAAISRFGIGILSTFMISDEIEVITKAEDDQEARNISIRSLNGKYLIRLLESAIPHVPDEIRLHGTSISLRIRAGLDLPDVLAIAKFWILFPGCDVFVVVNDGQAEKVGFDSTKQALTYALEKVGVTPSDLVPQGFEHGFKIVEYAEAGVLLAFVLQWSHAYKNWGAVVRDRLVMPGQNSVDTSGFPAVCIQGIRVESVTPGFATPSVLAVSNVTGMKSPETNVARSSIESGPLLDEMLAVIYKNYAAYISGEITEMSQGRGASISEAASEGRYLFSALNQPLTVNSKQAERLHRYSLKTIPWFTVDQVDERKLANINDLIADGTLWSIEGGPYSSAELFLRRMPSGVSLRKLVELTRSSIVLPMGTIVSGYSENTKILGFFLNHFEVDQIEMDSQAKQLSLRWTSSEPDTRWRQLRPTRKEQSERFAQISQVVIDRRYRPLALELDNVKIRGGNGEIGVRGSTRTFLFKGTAIHSYLSRRLDGVNSGLVTVENFGLDLAAVNWLIADESFAKDEIRLRVLEQLRATLSQHGFHAEADSELIALFTGAEYRMFDPFFGDRARGAYQSEMIM